MADVKRVSKRTEKARATRRKILAAAGELFVERGYGATSLQDVADRAGVAVQTIYFVFGNKRTVLKELADITIAGDDEPVATMDRPWFKDALASGTAAEHLRRHVHGARLILDRYAPMARVITAAAATDLEVADLWHYEEDPRYVVQSAAARSLVGKPGAREGVTAGQAADLLFGLLSPALYLVFVEERGWSPKRWEDWVYQTLRGQLCQ
jgi:AcrR family transcriptional regulator